MKSIQVDEKTWKKLQKIRINNDFKTMDGVIIYLISLEKKVDKLQKNHS